ncbi:MAG: TetR/AcrR family transcriptional regulator [Anaerolineales bacterium]
MKTTVDLSKGEVSRDRVLQAAFKLFVAQGYHGTSMREIGQSAGLTPASIYNHFENKEEVFRQVLLKHHPYHQILPILETAEGDDAELLIQGVARRVYKSIRTRTELLHLMFIELVEFEGRHFGEIFTTMSPRIYAFLNRLKASQAQLRPIPATNIMLTLIGLVMSQWILESMFLTNIKLPSSDKHFEDALDIYLHGILLPN